MCRAGLDETQHRLASKRRWVCTVSPGIEMKRKEDGGVGADTTDAIGHHRRMEERKKERKYHARLGFICIQQHHKAYLLHMLEEENNKYN